MANSTPSFILASSSPRRRQLLSWLGYRFAAVSPDVEERRRDGEPPEEFALRAARDKAQAVPLRDLPILAADTIVVLDGEVLGKPTSEAHARQLLQKLSGRTHEVITGVCLRHAAGKALETTATLAVSSRVTFRRLSDDEIAAYVASGEPLDKAGAYGVQGQGFTLIEAMTGSLTNVIGLPLTEVIAMLDKAGVALPERTPS